MNKDRLAAFTDAILAIIMTILVLELEKPSEASWAAVWALRQSFVSYIISFFWLGAMWVNLHSQWQRIKRIDNRVVWCSIVMLFFVLAVSFANIALNRYVGEANRKDSEFYNETKAVDRIMWIDIAIKVVGFGISMVICPPLTLAFVILAGLLPSVVAHNNQKKV